MEVRWASHFKSGDHDIERAFVGEMARDASPRVRLAAALLADSAGDPIALWALTSRDADDPWISAAILGTKLSKATGPGSFSELLLKDHNLAHTPGGSRFLQRFARACAADAQAVAAQRAIAQFATQPSIELPVDLLLLAALADGLASQGKSLSSILVPDTQAKAAEVARHVLAIPREGLAIRLAAARLLDPKSEPGDADVLLSIIAASEPVELQRAALEQLAPRPPEDALPLAKKLLARWKDFAPAFQSEVVRFMATRPARAQLLLQEVKGGHIAAADISTVEAAKLQQSKDPAVAALAKELLPKPSTATRDEVIKQFEPALGLAGDKAKGHEIYTQRCAVCHRFKGEGNAFGPDLESVVTGGKEKILTHFIDPNREVAPQFGAYTVEM
jgi:mono/diheme cytochrome c family protein